MEYEKCVRYRLDVVELAKRLKEKNPRQQFIYFATNVNADAFIYVAVQLYIKIFPILEGAFKISIA